MKFSIFNFRFPISRRNGIVSLGATLLLGAIIVEIAMTVAFLAYVLNFSNFGIRLSAEALAAAQAGIDDGLMRIIRNDFSSPTCPAYLCHFESGLAVGNASVAFRICKGVIGSSSTSDCGTTPATGKYEIISKGSRLNKFRQRVAIVEVDAFGLMKITSIQEIRA